MLRSCSCRGGVCQIDLLVVGTSWINIHADVCGSIHHAWLFQKKKIIMLACWMMNYYCFSDALSMTIDSKLVKLLRVYPAKKKKNYCVFSSHAYSETGRQYIDWMLIDGSTKSDYHCCIVLLLLITIGGGQNDTYVKAQLTVINRSPDLYRDSGLTCTWSTTRLDCILQ